MIHHTALCTARESGRYEDNCANFAKITTEDNHFVSAWLSLDLTLETLLEGCINRGAWARELAEGFELGERF